jgi:hypothetical protein
MGLFEYLFERKNPGKVGSIKKNNQGTKHVNILTLIGKLFVSLVIIGVLFYMTVMQNFHLINVAFFIIILFLYCYISYKYIPRPDTSNVGWLGGLMDNPFRYTDDLNRMLIVFLVLLSPGRFIATTFIQFILLLKKHR